MKLPSPFRWLLAGAAFLLAVWAMAAVLTGWQGGLAAHEND